MIKRCSPPYNTEASVILKGVEVSTTQANTEVNKIYVTLWLPHYGWKKINIHGTLDTAFGERIMGLTKENIFIECKIIKFGT